MDFSEYQALALRTAARTDSGTLLQNGVMGLCGEAGECIDIVKKHLFQGHGLDRDKLIGEAGDCLWYLANLAEGLGVSLDEIAVRNIEKLRKRYPDGFETERSVKRTV
ncbi:MAG: nucleoside triphosphate pyrophosphohydrolase family protein [Oscillospiraceae bacterium]|jgi:NTP pyrophosphatase (non-canonical NTP hydrolase)|nr:nucleoside triphosphate pyrophosphohydrolase family protein [Oscillospiraceae bacterium]